MELPGKIYWKRRFFCIQCKLPIKPPIYYCQNVVSPHPVCSDCKTCLAKSLGFCDAKPSQNRSAVLETLLQSANFTCEFGCSKGLFTSASYRSHVATCHLRPLECCLCAASIPFSGYLQHLSSVHFVQSQQKGSLGGNFGFDFKLGQPRVEYAEMEEHVFIFRYENQKFWVEILSSDENAEVDYFVSVSGLHEFPLGTQLKLVNCREDRHVVERTKNGFFNDFYPNVHFVVPGRDDLLHVSIIPENDNLSISSLDDFEEAYDTLDEVHEGYQDFAQQYLQSIQEEAAETETLILEKRGSLGNLLASSHRNSLSDQSSEASSDQYASAHSSGSMSDGTVNVSHIFNQWRESSPAPQFGRSKSPKKTQVDFLLQEVLTTEQNHVRGMNDVLAGYGSAAVSSDFALSHLLPSHLKKYSTTVVLPDHTTRTNYDYDVAIFGNLNDVFLFHCREFLPMLETSMDGASSVAVCFITHVPSFLTLYSRYCQLLPSCMKLLRDIGKDDPWLKACQHRLNHKFDLESYLVTVVQRITKYPLFFQGLIKHCADHEELQILEEANQAVIDMVHGVNRSMMQIHIASYGNLQNEGLFIKHAPFRVWTENDQYRISGHQRHCFLYEKCILICKKDPNPKKATLHFKLRLSLFDIGLTETVPGNHSNRFELWTTGKEKSKYLFEAEEQPIKEDWITAITKILKQQLEDARIARRLERGLPPSPSTITLNVISHL